LNPRQLIAALCTLVCVVATPAAQSGKNDPIALAQQAVAAMEERRFGDALDLFTQAAKVAPRDPSLSLGAGVAAFRLGQNDQAETWLESALKLDPSYTSASEWLGELQYRQGRVKEAISTYEAALKRAPRTESLERRLADWQKESQLQDRFYESRGAHFRVLFEGPADEALARRVVERLEAEYWRIGAALTAYPPKAITVVLYTTEQFRDITRMPEWSSGAYDGRIHVPIRGALAQPDQLDRVLSHEFVHAVVAMLGGRNVPVWLNEGLAVVFEAGGIEDAERALTRTATRPPLQKLHGSFNQLSAVDARVAYAFSAHAVQRMIAIRGPYAIVALLQDLSRGAQFASAFQQRMAMRYEDFQLDVARQ
jgi:tetratricopeptide (TPR) repeat protein